MENLLADTEVIERIFQHIDDQTTDLGEETWQEPTDNYVSLARFAAEVEMFRRVPLVFCPSVALQGTGDYVARPVAGIPIIVVRDRELKLRAYRNACRHRGMQLVDGMGCEKAFVCGYHGWAYGLDGKLQHIPHDYGFPDIDRDSLGLVPIHNVVERDGLVFVSVDEPVSDGVLEVLPPLLDPQQAIFSNTDNLSDVNWKLNIEATLEGYHIKPTHKETFYPYGFDNLNVVETFGANSRVTFPFRRIEKLRSVSAGERDISGMVTYLYHLFPNASLAVLSDHTTLSISEPVSPTRTRQFTYKLGNRGSTTDPERARRDAKFVSDSGGKEDAAVVRQIQSGIASGANSHFTYGRFEKAIVHFHKMLSAHMGMG